MKVKDMKKINIAIDGDENTKSEVVYNNVIQNLDLTNEEQINYLKTKVTYLELEMKNKNLTILLSIISLIGISFGLFLMIQDLYLLGSIFIITTFIGVVVRFYLMYKNIAHAYKNMEFEKIETIRKLINEKLR